MFKQHLILLYTVHYVSLYATKCSSRHWIFFWRCLSHRQPILWVPYRYESRSDIRVCVVGVSDVTCSLQGDVIRSEVHGRISMKSFLSNSPRLQIGLNDQVTVSQTRRHKAYGGGVHLDDCILHSGVDAETFERDATLAISPPEGEVTNTTLSPSALQRIEER